MFSGTVIKWLVPRWKRGKVQCRGAKRRDDCDGVAWVLENV